MTRLESDVLLFAFTICVAMLALRRALMNWEASLRERPMLKIEIGLGLSLAALHLWRLLTL